MDACHATALAKIRTRPDRIRCLELIGRERSLFYLMAVTTGLRRGELSSLTVGHLHLDAEPTPLVQLQARDAKNAKSASLPLRADVLQEIREYLKERQGSDTGAESLDASLFRHVPTVRIFDADLASAGIPKADARGRAVNIHALRFTFGTHLSKAGVAPRTAQAAMRHSRIDLTMTLYTDPALLDVAGAVDTLPRFCTPSVHGMSPTGTAPTQGSPIA